MGTDLSYAGNTQKAGKEGTSLTSGWSPLWEGSQDKEQNYGYVTA